MNWIARGSYGQSRLSRIAKTVRTVSARTLSQSDARRGNFIMLTRENGSGSTRRCFRNHLAIPQDQAIQTSFAISARQLLRSPLTRLCVPTAWVRAIAEVRSA